MKKLYLLLISLLMTFMFVGCSNVDSSLKEQGNLIGKVEQSVSPSNDKSLTILRINSGNNKNSKYDNGAVAITDQTNIYDEKGNKVGKDYIKVRSTIEVVFDGETTGDNPVQGTAKIVRVIK